jgi:hypothetical protein
MTDAKTPSLQGGCTCGEVRYRMASKPMFVHCCHCRWCQRESGSAFALNAIIEADRVLLLKGLPERLTIPTLSGLGQKFARCPRCRIALWSNMGALTPSFVRVGTLMIPTSYRRISHLHVFQTWALPPGAWVEEYYQRSLYWPKESLERRLAALAKAKGN